MPLKAQEKDKNQHIQVAVRLRPLNANEKKHGSYSVVDLDNVHKTISVKSSLSQFASNQKVFSYDNVFGPQTKQVEVYKTVVASALNEVLLGYNCTIFAYGQTGSGKTFTMEGERTDDASVSWEEDPLAGVIPRTLHHLFSRLQKQECEFSVRISFLEIYNEELIDLLGADSVENPRLKIYEDASKKGSCVIQGLEEVVVHDRDEVYAILKRGTNKRQTAATLLNAHSSRSHSVFMITVHIKENTVDGEELLKIGKLNLVDLAGSECIGRSGAVEKRAREAGSINQSLLTLGRVITALVEHAPHIPYRESKLTRLLQDSLGGRTKTSIIATISPASCNLEETISTLEYAHRAKSITNKPEINQKLTKRALIKEYTEEVERLRRDLQAARDKNGIYVAKENYDKMQTTDMMQKGLIHDLEEQLEFHKNELIKITELFSDTKLELEETAQELEVTTKDLEVTTENLHVTKKNLRKTKQERDEQSHLVCEQVKHDKQLSAQANELLGVANEATGEVVGLHAKVDRMKNTEQSNMSAQETFRHKFRSAVDSMQENREEFAKNHIEVNHVVQENLAEAVNKRMEQLTEQLDLVTSLSEQLDDGLKSLMSMDKSHTKHIHSETEQLNDRTKLYRDSTTEQTRQFQSEILSSLSSVLKTTVCCVKQDLELYHQESITAFEGLKQTSADIHESAVAFIARQKEAHVVHEQQLQAQYSAQLHAVSTSIQCQEQKQMELDHSLLEKMASMLTGMREEKSTLATQHLSMIETHDEENRTVTTVRSEQACSDLESLSSDLSSANKAITRNCTDNNERLGASVQQIQEKLSKIEDKQIELSTESSNYFTSSVKTLQAHCEETLQWSSTLKTTTATDVQERLTSTEESMSNHKANNSALMSKLKTHADDTSIAIQAEHTLLNENCKMFSDWSSSVCSALESRDQDVETFLTEDLAKDIPTGKTPQRHDFRYPVGLQKAPRHSTLLNQFRKEYVMDEAVNTPIPDLSFTESENGDTNAAVEGTVDSAEALNTSDDSAISTASNASTAVSDVTDKSNKENAWRPPSGRAPKATTHSRTNSQQSNKSTKRDRSNSSTRSSGDTTPARGGSKASIAKKNTPSGNKTKLPLRSSNATATS